MLRMLLGSTEQLSSDLKLSRGTQLKLPTKLTRFQSCKGWKQQTIIRQEQLQATVDVASLEVLDGGILTLNPAGICHGSSLPVLLSTMPTIYHSDLHKESILLSSQVNSGYFLWDDLDHSVIELGPFFGESMTTLLLSILLACNSELDNKTSATVNDAPAEAAPAANATTPAAGQPQGDPNPVKPTIEGTTLPISTTSTVEFVGAKVTSDHSGGFKRLSGNAIVGEDGSLKSVDAQIDMTSIYSDSDRLTGHLKSDDFFSVDAHPNAKFNSSKIETGEAGTTVTGTLTMRGVSKEISFPATVTSTASSASLSAEFKINRQLWGVSYAGKPDNLINDEVLIKLNVSYGN